MPMNPLIANNFIDSCAFDPKYSPEDAASTEILRLARESELLIQITHSTQKEIEHPNTPAWVKNEALGLIYTIEVDLSEIEVSILRKIEKILAGNGKIENIREDAKHVFEAQKYGSYFVTTDFRILKRAPELHSAFNVTILKPSEFLDIVTQYLDKQNHPLNTSSLNSRSGETRSQEKMKVDMVPYKDYRIEPSPYQLADSGEWAIRISIWHDTRDQTKVRGFGAGGTFKTKEEAIQRCVDFGKQIIDGKYPDCTVRDL